MGDKKNILRYVGSFPPPYGGVTIKNELLHRRLSKKFNIAKPKSNSKFSSLIWFLGSIFTHKKMIVGVSSVKGKSLLVTKILYYFNRKRMKNSLYFMMGGLESSRICKSKKEIQMYSQYKRVFVETSSMKQELEKCGMTNIEYYPNCRENVDHIIKHPHNGFKCVFLSFISPDKGVNDILDVAKQTANIIFDLYGEIEDSYREDFISMVSAIPNVRYCGVFKSSKNYTIYQKLSEYDVLLLPSHWKNEGVPGVLIESKIAGIPAIVTEIANKSSIINDRVDGIVIDSSTSQLKKAIDELAKDRLLLNKLSNGARISSRAFSIDNYISMIESFLI